MTARAGFLHWVFPAMLVLVAFEVLLSGRDLAQALSDLETGSEQFRNAAFTWAQRLVSVLLLAASAERIVSHVALRRPVPSPLLLWAFILYWLASVAAPAVFGTHPQIGHEFAYSLAIGAAVLLVNALERDRILDASRNTLFLLMAAGVLLIPFMPSLVLDASYTQGLIPGLPRLGGLAPHPVSLGMLAQTALLLLWCRPYASRWLNGLAWMLGAGVLFLAQSKTAWIAFIACSLCLLAVRRGKALWSRIGDPRQGAFGILACLAVITVVLALLGWILLGDVEAQAQGFLNSTQGAQLVSMTGRDRIWTVAMEEWRSNPLFGYGPGLWDTAFRASIGMPNATHAHNQFMDTLARSGSIGAAALVLYAGVLLVLAVRYAGRTGGLSLAMFVALALRSISEVPVLLLGYGTELFMHLLLLVTLAGAARLEQSKVRKPATAGWEFST